ncbi:MAG: sodium/proton-translocating pyrophosphatase, partial [Paracoccaceae bacterium]
EDDPRNPAVIADNVGDNVGDVAGMGADLFESFVGSLVAAMTLGTVLSTEHVVFPLFVAVVGIIAAIIGSRFVNIKSGGNPAQALNKGAFISYGITFIGTAFLAYFLLGNWGAFWAVVSGIIAGILIGKITEYYTSAEYGPVKYIAK